MSLNYGINVARMLNLRELCQLAPPKIFDVILVQCDRSATANCGLFSTRSDAAANPQNKLPALLALLVKKRKRTTGDAVLGAGREICARGAFTARLAHNNIFAPYWLTPFESCKVYSVWLQELADPDALYTRT